MKKLIVLLLIAVVLGFSGCLQNPAATNNATVTPGTGNLTISTATISSDIESISKEVASIDTNDSGNAITPITDVDMTID